MTSFTGAFVRSRRRTVALLLVLGAALAGGVAYAAIPDSGNVYSACMLRATGTVRLIDPSLPATNLLGHCTSLEAPISWNQKGPAGPQGSKGDPGAKGDPGQKGNPGAQGDAGAKGDPGSKGDPGAKGDPGLAGDSGAKGDPGTNGTNGTDGVSVTSASEAPGANCAAGGSKFTSVSGDTYACNGAAGTGGGPNGQDAITALGTASLTVTSFTFAQVPGLSAGVDVPPNSVLYLSTDGGFSPAAPCVVAGCSVIVDVQLLVDGTSVAFRRLDAFDNAAVWQGPIGTWSMAITSPLPAGHHTIAVEARLAGSFQAPGGAIVSAGNGTNIQGALNVLTIAK